MNLLTCYCGKYPADKISITKNTIFVSFQHCGVLAICGFSDERSESSFNDFEELKNDTIKRWNKKVESEIERRKYLSDELLKIKELSK